MTARQFHFTKLLDLPARGIQVLVRIRDKVEEVAAIRPALNAISSWQTVLVKGADV